MTQHGCTAYTRSTLKAPRSMYSCFRFVSFDVSIQKKVFAEGTFDLFHWSKTQLFFRSVFSHNGGHRLELIENMSCKLTLACVLLIVTAIHVPQITINPVHQIAVIVVNNHWHILRRMRNKWEYRRRRPSHNNNLSFFFGFCKNPFYIHIWNYSDSSQKMVFFSFN